MSCYSEGIKLEELMLDRLNCSAILSRCSADWSLVSPLAVWLASGTVSPKHMFKDTLLMIATLIVYLMLQGIAT